MKETFDKLLEIIKNRIEKEIKWSDDMLYAVLCAYNKWQEDERDGVDYIFNIDNNKDLECCVRGGMSATDIAWLVDKFKSCHSNYFLFGNNHQTPEPFASKEELVKYISYSIADFLPYVFFEPSAYTELYDLLMYDFVFRNYIDQ